jgi:hypothetical protein
MNNINHISEEVLTVLKDKFRWSVYMDIYVHIFKKKQTFHIFINYITFHGKC